MKTITNMLTLCCVLALSTFGSCFGQQTNAPTLKSKGYASVNGIKMYYEVHGEGEPIVLLHGAYMTIDMNWAQLIPELVKTRKVIAFELQGHGHTELTNRPYSYTTMAKDVSEALKFLKIEQADIVGYSFGGTVAWALAFDHPEQVKTLTIVSSVYRYDGWQPAVRDVLKTMKPEFFDNTPLKPAYEAVASDPKQWYPFLNKMMEFDTQEFNLGDAKVAQLKMPVLLISGDNDGVDKTMLLNTYTQLGGNTFADMNGQPKSQLAIHPGKAHVTLMMDTQAIFSTINGFLNPPTALENPAAPSGE
jgi:pimeloyl-ACP methyl ester carboxylesterase